MERCLVKLCVGGLLAPVVGIAFGMGSAMAGRALSGCDALDGPFSCGEGLGRGVAVVAKIATFALLSLTVVGPIVAVVALVAIVVVSWRASRLRSDQQSSSPVI